NIGIEFAFDEVIVFKGNALALQGDLEQRVLAHELKNFVGDVFDNARAGIVILVDAMAKSHQLYFAGFDPLDEVGNLLNRANLHQHVQNFFIGTAVERADRKSTRLNSSHGSISD